MSPFRDLLKKRTDFYWDEQLTDVFLKARKHIVEQIHNGVKTFELGRETALTTDYSKKGIGFFLQQKYCKCSEITPHCSPGHWKLVVAGSRFTKDAEQNYAPIEGEALAMTYGLTTAKMYCLGNTFSIMGKKPMDQIDNPRLLAFKRKCTSQFEYKMIYIPGKDHIGPDATSRYPGGPGDGNDGLEEDENGNIETSRAVLRDFKFNSKENIETSRAKFNLKNGAVIAETIHMMCVITGEEGNQVNSVRNDVEEEVRIMAMDWMDSFKTITWEEIREECILDEESAEVARAIRNGFPEVKK